MRRRWCGSGWAGWVLGIGLCLATPLGHAADEPKGVYLILDGSGSMWGRLPDRSTKIVTAKEVLQEFVTSDFGGAELALRAYGHRREGDCRDSELLIPFGAVDEVRERLPEALESLTPLGKTPISYSLRQALEDFDDRPGEIVLVSDGIETCNEDPCALVREWAKKDIDIRIHVVGFGVDGADKKQMQCIAEAAGTTYHDARSAKDLAASLRSVHEVSTTNAFYLKAKDPEGNLLVAEGQLSSPAHQGPIPVKTHSRHVVNPGTYELEVGIRTANGNLFRPIIETVEVIHGRDTTAVVELEVPPRVRAEFKSRGEERKGSLVSAFQNGELAFRFRPIDEVYVDEGSYEFRAKPVPRTELSVDETLAAGDRKTIVFDLAYTVRVKIKMVAADSGIWFRQNYELWQDGERKYGVHAHNGADVVPGTYDLHLTDKLTPFVEKGVVIKEDREQEINVSVPVGHFTVVYQNADGSPAESKRCFVGKGEEGSGFYRNAGQRYPVVPGTYNATGWRGDYAPVVFEVVEGEDVEVVLRAR